MFVNEEKWTWHIRLSHVSMRKISKLNKLNLIKGLLNLEFASDAFYEACQKGKFSKISFKAKNAISTSKPLQLLHIDLFGTVKIVSVNGKKCGLVIVDDYNRWTQVKFLRHKDESPEDHRVRFKSCEFFFCLLAFNSQSVCVAAIWIWFV